jgi:hypothetical protein
MSARGNVVSLFEALPAESQQFIAFWYRYPRKQARAEAERAWWRLSQADRAAALERIPAQVAQWQLSGTQRRFIPHASTWLNQRRWEDEIEDLDSPLTDLGQCDWNRHGTREPGRPRCEDRARVSAPNGNCYCTRHAPMAGAGGRR